MARAKRIRQKGIGTLHAGGIGPMLAANCQHWGEWLRIHGFPADIRRPAKIALAELGEFATDNNVGEIPMDTLRELLQTCVDRRQWLAKTHVAAKPAAAAEFVESDFAELIFKSDLAVLFGVDRATIHRRIVSGELRTMPGTLDTAKKVRIHGDDFPAGLKRPNERKQKLSSVRKRGKRQ